MYEVRLSPEAEAFYAAADAPLARKLARCFAALEVNPRGGNNVKRLKGSLQGLYRYRVGDWRVVYQIVDRQLIILVVTIAHRGEVYGD